MRIELPDRWSFSTEIGVRITDLNYGNHLANQNFLVYAQESRMRFLAEFGFSEMDFGGSSLIQADAAVMYKGEGFYGDVIEIKVKAEQSGHSSFNIYYLMQLKKDGKPLAHIRTAMVCYDYNQGKAMGIPEKVLKSGFFD